MRIECCFEDETIWLTQATELALRELGFSENIELKPRSR